MVVTMNTLDKYQYIIWDRIGFHEGVAGWIIQINDEVGNYFGEVLLDEKEAESLGLEHFFQGYDIWGRDTGEITWAQVLSDYSPEIELIDKIAEVIKTGPHKQEW